MVAKIILAVLLGMSLIAALSVSVEHVIHVRETTVHSLDLPEEIPMVKAGDTLVMYTMDSTTYIEFSGVAYPKPPVGSRRFVVR